MMTLTGSVGNGGDNREGDVRYIQYLLLFAMAKAKDSRLSPGIPDGKISKSNPAQSQTVRAIQYFQSAKGFAKPKDKDFGLVASGSKTLAKLHKLVGSGFPELALSPPSEAILSGDYRFPLNKTPISDYTKGGIAFGAVRKNIDAQGKMKGFRIHAGCDLYTGGSAWDVYPVANGKVDRVHLYFKNNTHAVDVRHDAGFWVRYGEIEPLRGLCKKGAELSKEEPLGRVGLQGKHTQLHFEIYSGAMTGPLTVEGAPGFERRADLLNPTAYLRAWQWKS
jgi:murein DD-endopeptidase MepM/ murein hydrolase activator NlpD